jgi:hypothetical protein
MAIRKFIDDKFDGYYFDTELDAVVSTKKGQPKPLAWSIKAAGGLRTLPHNAPSYDRSARLVALIPTHGWRVIYTYNQIIKMLHPSSAAEVDTGIPGLADIKPNYEYVVFSVANRCSQYFYAGTSIQDALGMFAKRGITLNPKEIQILNPATGKISKMEIKTVETYSLA